MKLSGLLFHTVTVFPAGLPCVTGKSNTAGSPGEPGMGMPPPGQQMSEADRQRMNPDSQSGTYALVLHSDCTTTITVGRCGRLRLQQGCYIYVGSAFGPGGVEARVRHHRGISARPHWHIDYLRPELRLVEVWFTHDPEHREHQWAAIFAAWRGTTVPLPGFGASDCRCPSHLFHLIRPPEFKRFRRKAAAFSAGGITLLRAPGEAR